MLFAAVRLSRILLENARAHVRYESFGRRRGKAQSKHTHTIRTAGKPFGTGKNHCGQKVKEYSIEFARGF